VGSSNYAFVITLYLVRMGERADATGFFGGRGHH
jgi:hypothetical protein